MFFSCLGRSKYRTLHSNHLEFTGFAPLRGGHGSKDRDRAVDAGPRIVIEQGTTGAALTDYFYAGGSIFEYVAERQDVIMSTRLTRLTRLSKLT